MGWQVPHPGLQAAPETAEHRGLAAAVAPDKAMGRGSAGRGLWVPQHNSCQRYPEAARPGRTAACGLPAVPVMPPVCTGASGPSLPRQGKSRPCCRVSSRDAKTGPLGDPALGPAPGQPGREELAVALASLHPVSRISRSRCPAVRRAAAGSDPGRVSGREKQPASLPPPPAALGEQLGRGSLCLQSLCEH